MPQRSVPPSLPPHAFHGLLDCQLPGLAYRARRGQSPQWFRSLLVAEGLHLCGRADEGHLLALLGLLPSRLHPLTAEELANLLYLEVTSHERFSRDHERLQQVSRCLSVYLLCANCHKPMVPGVPCRGILLPCAELIVNQSALRRFALQNARAHTESPPPSISRSVTCSLSQLTHSSNMLLCMHCLL